MNTVAEMTMAAGAERARRVAADPGPRGAELDSVVEDGSTASIAPLPEPIAVLGSIITTRGLTTGVHYSRPSPAYAHRRRRSAATRPVTNRVSILKGECLDLHDVQTAAEMREVIGQFIEPYNREWLIERQRPIAPRPTSAEVSRQVLPDQAACLSKKSGPVLGASIRSAGALAK